MDHLSSADPSASDTIPWASIMAAIAAISAVGIAIGLGLPLLSVILEKRGVSSSLIGLNSAMAGLASMAVAPVTTQMAARFGVANTMLMAILVAAVSAIGFYFAHAFWMWFPLRLFFHGAITILFILSEFWINAAAPSARRGLVLGVYATVLSLGFATGPALFALIGSNGILPFAVAAAVILLAALPIFIARNDNPVLEPGPQGPFVRFIWLVPTATAAVFVFGAVESGVLALFPIYAGRSGFSESQGALLLMMIGLGNVLFQIPIGLLADRVRDRRILLVTFATIGLCGAMLLPFVVQNWLMIAIILLFWGGCVAGLYTVGLTHLGSRLNGRDLASANAAFVFCYSIGMLTGPQTIGASMDLFGNNGFAWSLALYFGLYLALALSRLARSPRSVLR